MRNLAVLILLTACACGPPPEMTREKAKGMIEASLAFQAPLDEDLRKPGFDSSMKREILTVEALTVKPDGPLGMAGETASATFTWRWTQGPLAGIRFSTLAKMHGSSSGWTLYEDKLAQSLRVSISGGD